jgi:hypothetical protein
VGSTCCRAFLGEVKLLHLIEAQSRVSQCEGECDSFWLAWDGVVSRKSNTKTEIGTARVWGRPQRLALFDPPPLLEGEDPDAYDELLQRFYAAVKPVDSIEEMFVAEIVFLEWEILRWRRLKWSLIRAHGLDVLVVSRDCHMSNVLSKTLDYIERIDRLTAIAESRRNASLREIERHRAVFGETLQRSVQDIEDAEFKVIETTSAKEKNPV